MRSAKQYCLRRGALALMVMLSLGCTDLANGSGDKGDGGGDGATGLSPGDAATTGACEDDRDCARSHATPFCDPWRGRCSECLFDRDCSAGESCIQRRCVAETRCTSSLDCALGAVCDAPGGRCVECTQNAECEGDFRCDTGTHACRARCASDLDCTRARMLCDRPTGLCVVPPASATDGGADGAVIDGSPDAAAVDGGPDASSSQTDGGPTCPSVALELVRLIPSVMLVVDGSGSMLDPFDVGGSGGIGEVSRWVALRDALVGVGQGIVPMRQKLVRFGLAVFRTMPSCPTPYGIISPALDNADALVTVLSASGNDGGNTPTGEALALVVDQLPDPTVSAVGPQVIILATEGEPNGCAGGASDPVAVLAAARAARAKHHTLHVVSVGGLTVPNYLQQVANLGAGLAMDANPGAPLHVPANPAALTSTLGAIVDAELSCDFEISGRQITPGAECRGSIQLDGTALECNGADGWSLLDPTHVRLHGAACATLKSQTAVLTADFPCDAVTAR
jgi:hypothetical protein